MGSGDLAKAQIIINDIFTSTPVEITTILLCFRAVFPVCFSNLGVCQPSSTVGYTQTMNNISYYRTTYIQTIPADPWIIL